MSDPIKDFFKRDLSDEEKKLLAKQISASDESAARFAQLAEDFYKEIGQPEPVWKGGDWPSSGAKWWFVKPLIPLVLILSLVGFVYYKWSSQASSLSSGDLAVPALKHEPLQSQIEKPGLREPKAVMEGESPRTSVETVPSVQTSSQTRESASSIPAPLRTSPASASGLPPQLPALPRAGRKYQELSVVVDRPTGGVASVGVFDSTNNEIRMIYTGILPAGERTFTWDGKTDQGAVAPPGDYSIEVKSGENTLRHKVRVNGNNSP